MSKKDYTRYSNSNKPAIEQNQNDAVQHLVQEPAKEVAEPIKQEEQPVQEVAEVVKPEPVEVKQFGVVTGCVILNVRENPSKDAEILCTIPCDAKVEIDNEVGDFYGVTTEAGVEGFCMKNYIDVRK